MKNETAYHVFDPALSLDENFHKDTTPLLMMEHLRMLDYSISRGISYEKTVDEFMIQLATNDSLRSLRNCPEVVILLNQEGALIRHDGIWELLFSPDQIESEGSLDPERLPLHSAPMDWAESSMTISPCLLAICMIGSMSADCP